MLRLGLAARTQKTPGACNASSGTPRTSCPWRAQVARTPRRKAGRGRSGSPCRFECAARLSLRRAALRGASRAPGCERPIDRSVRALGVSTPDGPFSTRQCAPAAAHEAQACCGCGRPNHGAKRPKRPRWLDGLARRSCEASPDRSGRPSGCSRPGESKKAFCRPTNGHFPQWPFSRPFFPGSEWYSHLGASDRLEATAPHRIHSLAPWRHQGSGHQHAYGSCVRRAGTVHAVIHSPQQAFSQQSSGAAASRSRSHSSATNMVAAPVMLP